MLIGNKRFWSFPPRSPLLASLDLEARGLRVSTSLVFSQPFSIHSSEWSEWVRRG